MDIDTLLETVVYAGKLLIESGAEIYRVEETMVRMSRSFKEVEDAQSFVLATGIMFSLTAQNKTVTKILRVHTRSVDLHCIHRINQLSREMVHQTYTLTQLSQELTTIAQEKRYSFFTTMMFGALGAGGFALFFDGTWREAFCTFFIGIMIKIVTGCMEKIEINAFLTHAVAAAVAGTCSIILHTLFPITNLDIMIISSIMLLVPGLAITNAIRDTVAGDYLSGVARAVEAVLVAIAIAFGVGIVVSIFLGMQGGFTWL